MGIDRALGPEDAFCRLVTGVTPLTPEWLASVRDVVASLRPDWAEAWPWSEGPGALESAKTGPARFDAARLHRPTGPLAPKVFAYLVAEGPSSATDVARSLHEPLQATAAVLAVGERAGWARRVDDPLPRWRLRPQVVAALRTAPLSPLGCSLLSRRRRSATVSARLAANVDAQAAMALAALEGDPKTVEGLATEWPVTVPATAWTPIGLSRHRLRMDVAIWTPRSDVHPTIDIEQETSPTGLEDRVRAHAASALALAASAMTHVELWFTYRSSEVQGARIERYVRSIPRTQPGYKGSVRIGVLPLSAALKSPPWTSSNARVVVEPFRRTVS